MTHTQSIQYSNRLLLTKTPAIKTPCDAIGLGIPNTSIPDKEDYMIREAMPASLLAVRVSPYPLNVPYLNCN